MIRNFFRCVASVLLFAAVVAAVTDAVRSVAASKLVFEPMQHMLSVTGLVDISALKNEITQRYGADLWLIVDSGVLQAPIWFLCGVLALSIYIVTYRSPKPFAFLWH